MRTVELHEFRDSFFPYDSKAIKEIFHGLSSRLRPDLIFTHRREDAHQDHRVLAELTWCAFRDHLILEYEIPKYEGDLGAPNLFVQLGEEIVPLALPQPKGAQPQSRAPWMTYFLSDGLLPWLTASLYKERIRKQG